MSPIEVVEAFYAAGTGGDVDALAAFFTADAVWDNRIDDDPLGGLHEGRAAIRDLLLSPLFQFLPAGIHTTVERMFATDGSVVCLNTGRGTTVTGDAFEKRYAHVFDFEGERFRRVTEFRS
ncbi:MAG TPA: nuclear transport factor 2 family protein [Pseudomonadales bacterium]